MSLVCFQMLYSSSPIRLFFMPLMPPRATSWYHWFFHSIPSHRPLLSIPPSPGHLCHFRNEHCACQSKCSTGRVSLTDSFYKIHPTWYQAVSNHSNTHVLSLNIDVLDRNAIVLAGYSANQNPALDVLPPQVYVVSSLFSDTMIVSFPSNTAAKAMQSHLRILGSAVSMADSCLYILAKNALTLRYSIQRYFKSFQGAMV